MPDAFSIMQQTSEQPKDALSIMQGMSGQQDALSVMQGRQDALSAMQQSTTPPAPEWEGSVGQARDRRRALMPPEYKFMLSPEEIQTKEEARREKQLRLKKEGMLIDPVRAAGDPQYKEREIGRALGVQEATIETAKHFVGGPDPLGIMEGTLKFAGGITGLDYFEEQAKKYGLEGKVYTPAMKLAGRAWRTGILAAGAELLVPTVTAPLSAKFAGLGTPGQIMAHWIGAGVRNASLFAGDETIDQVADFANTEKKVTWDNALRAGRAIGEEAAFSFGTGMINFIPNVKVKTPLYLVARGTWETFRARRDDGRISNEEIGQIILTTGAMGALEYFSGQKVWKQAEENKGWNDYLKRIDVTPRDVEGAKKAGTALITQYLPQEFHGLEVTKKINLLTDLTNKMASGTSISDAIDTLSVPSVDLKSPEATVNIKDSISKLMPAFEVPTLKPEMPKGIAKDKIITKDPLDVPAHPLQKELEQMKEELLRAPKPTEIVPGLTYEYPAYHKALKGGTPEAEAKFIDKILAGEKLRKNQIVKADRFLEVAEGLTVKDLAHDLPQYTDPTDEELADMIDPEGFNWMSGQQEGEAGGVRIQAFLDLPLKVKEQIVATKNEVFKRTFFGYKLSPERKREIVSLMNSPEPLGEKSALLARTILMLDEDVKPITNKQWEKWLRAYETTYKADKDKFQELTADIPNAMERAERFNDWTEAQDTIHKRSGAYKTGAIESIVIGSDIMINQQTKMIERLTYERTKNANLLKSFLKGHFKEPVTDKDAFRKRVLREVKSIDKKIATGKEKIRQAEAKKAFAVDKLSYAPRYIQTQGGKRIEEYLTSGWGRGKKFATKYKKLGREYLTREEGAEALVKKKLEYVEDLPAVLAEDIALTFHHDTLNSYFTKLKDQEMDVLPEFNQDVIDNKDDWILAHRGDDNFGGTEKFYNNQKFYIDDLDSIKDPYEFTTNTEGEELIQFATGKEYTVLKEPGTGKAYFKANYKIQEYLHQAMKEVLPYKYTVTDKILAPLDRIQYIRKRFAFYNPARMHINDLGESLQTNHSLMFYFKDWKQASNDYMTHTGNFEAARLTGLFSYKNYLKVEDLHAMVKSGLDAYNKTLGAHLKNELGGAYQDLKEFRVMDALEKERKLTFMMHDITLLADVNTRVAKGMPIEKAVEQALDRYGGGGIFTKAFLHKVGNRLILTPQFFARQIKLWTEVAKDPDANVDVLIGQAEKHGLAFMSKYIFQALAMMGLTGLAGWRLTHGGRFEKEVEVGPLGKKQIHVKTLPAALWFPERLLTRKWEQTIQYRAQIAVQVLNDYYKYFKHQDIKDWKHDVRVYGKREITDPKKWGELAAYHTFEFLALPEDILRVYENDMKSSLSVGAAIIAGLPEYYRDPERNPNLWQKLSHYMREGRYPDKTELDRLVRLEKLEKQLFSEETQEIIRTAKTKPEAYARLVQAGKLTGTDLANIKRLQNITDPSSIRRTFGKLKADKKLIAYELLTPENRKKVSLEMIMEPQTFERALKRRAIREMPFEEITNIKTNSQQ